jgi:hypothetical protein
MHADRHVFFLIRGTSGAEIDISLATNVTASPPGDQPSDELVDTSDDNDDEADIPESSVGAGTYQPLMPRCPTSTLAARYCLLELTYSLRTKQVSCTKSC